MPATISDRNRGRARQGSELDGLVDPTRVKVARGGTEVQHGNERHRRLPCGFGNRDERVCVIERVKRPHPTCATLSRAKHEPTHKISSDGALTKEASTGDVDAHGSPPNHPHDRPEAIPWALRPALKRASSAHGVEHLKAGRPAPSKKCRRANQFLGRDARSDWRCDQLPETRVDPANLLGTHARPMYSRERVSTFTRSPSFTKSGT